MLKQKDNRSLSVTVIKRNSFCNMDIVLNEKNKEMKQFVFVIPREKEMTGTVYSKSIKLLFLSSCFGHLIYPFGVPCVFPLL